jgi:hypothetical protein
MAGLRINSYFSFPNDVSCVGQFRGRSVLAFRYAPLLSPPKPATAYALALCGIRDPIERRQKKNRSVLAEFFKLHGLQSLSLD